LVDYVPDPDIRVTADVLSFSQVGKLLNTPWVKFVAQATSYLFFLCVILAHGHVEQDLAHGHVEQGKLCLTRVEDVQPLYRYYRQARGNLTTSLQRIDSMCIRNHKPAAMEFLIVLWITGLKSVTHRSEIGVKTDLF